MLSNAVASMLFKRPASLPAMPRVKHEPSKYGERLRLAMQYGQKLKHDEDPDQRALAKQVGCSSAAIGQVLRGASRFLRADNHAEAARVLGVDPYWLGTGKGVMIPAGALGAAEVAAAQDLLRYAAGLSSQRGRRVVEQLERIEDRALAKQAENVAVQAIADFYLAATAPQQPSQKTPTARARRTSAKR